MLFGYNILNKITVRTLADLNGKITSVQWRRGATAFTCAVNEHQGQQVTENCNTGIWKTCASWTDVKTSSFYVYFTAPELDIWTQRISQSWIPWQWKKFIEYLSSPSSSNGVFRCCTCRLATFNVKRHSSLYTLIQAPRAPEFWSSHDFQTTDTWRRQGCHPYAPAAFIPQGRSLVLISLTG